MNTSITFSAKVYSNLDFAIVMIRIKLMQFRKRVPFNLERVILLN